MRTSWCERECERGVQRRATDDGGGGGDAAKRRAMTTDVECGRAADRREGGWRGRTSTGRWSTSGKRRSDDDLNSGEQREAKRAPSRFQLSPSKADKKPTDGDDDDEGRPTASDDGRRRAVAATADGQQATAPTQNAVAAAATAAAVASDGLVDCVCARFSVRPNFAFTLVALVVEAPLCGHTTMTTSGRRGEWPDDVCWSHTQGRADERCARTLAAIASLATRARARASGSRARRQRR